MWKAGMILAGALTLAACETLPLPGLGENEPASAPPQTRSVAAEPAMAERGGDGVEGAALCLAASEYVLEVGGVAAADEVASVWNSILDVIAADEARKTGAARDIYAHFANLDAQEAAGQGLNAAAAVYEESCADPEDQRTYLTEWGDPALMAERIDGSSE